MQIAVETEFDDETSPFLEWLTPDACSKAPVSDIFADDLRKAAAMQVGKVFPIDGVLVKPFKIHRQFTPIGSDMRNFATGACERVHCLILIRKPVASNCNAANLPSTI